MTTMTEESGAVTGGVDTHRDTHVAAVLDARGAQLGVAEFPATAAGYEQLVEWMGSFGTIDRVGVEGTGTYGKGLARHLHDQAITVIEVDRPNRQRRRRNGKSDTADAIAAARATQGGEATGLAKTGDGPVEQLRILRVLRESNRRERIRAINKLRSLIVTAPDKIRADLVGRPVIGLCQHVARYRVADPLDPAGTLRYAMRALGRRADELRTENKKIDKMIRAIVTDIAPELIDQPYVGPDAASALLVAAGDNPHRLRSEAAFAKLCGAAPLDASSGQQHRHRLSRAGDRQANAALYRIIIGRMKTDPATRAYIERRHQDGKTTLEAIRCLKRYIARDLYPLVIAANST